MKTLISRRCALAMLGGSALIPTAARTASFTDLNWTDLTPKDQPAIPPVLQSLLDHDQNPLSIKQPSSTGVRTDWNGQIVRLPGYVVPIEYSGTGITAFILVPYVGACVHVPPPPANQLVFVTTEKPYQSSGLFEAVNVIGMFGVSAVSTHIAQVGYALSADQIVPFKR